MMIPLTISAVAEVFAERFVLCLLGGAVLSAGVWGILRVTRFGSRTRYLVWWTALIASAVLLAPQVALRSTQTSEAAITAPITVPGSWATYMLAFWVVGVAVGVFRLLVGFDRVRRLRRSCTPLRTEDLPAGIKELLEGSFGGRSVQLCTSDSISVPSALGFFKPMIVIPRQLLHEFSSADLKQIVIHEMAHLNFWDDWANLGQKFLRTLLFFHPAAWLIDRQLTAEREMACDDFVVQHTGDSRAYARCLASVAELSFVRRTASLVNAALGRGGQTSVRVGRLLKMQTPATHHVLRPVIAVSAVLFMAAFSIRAYTPTLVEFSSGSDTVSTAKVDSGIDRAVDAVPLRQAPPAPKVKLAKSGEQAAVVSATKPSRPKDSGMTSAHGSTEPKLTLAKSEDQPVQRIRVEQAYFAVVSDGANGIESFSVYQLTVWHEVPPKAPKPVDHKTT